MCHSRVSESMSSCRPKLSPAVSELSSHWIMSCVCAQRAQGYISFRNDYDFHITSKCKDNTHVVHESINAIGKSTTRPPGRQVPNRPQRFRCYVFVFRQHFSFLWLQPALRESLIAPNVVLCVLMCCTMLSTTPFLPQLGPNFPSNMLNLLVIYSPLRMRGVWLHPSRIGKFRTFLRKLWW